MSPPAPRATLLYDGECGFCTWCAGAVLAWDRRRVLRAVPIQGEEGDVLLAGMPTAERRASWHLALAGGERTSAGAAVAPLLRLLPAGRPAAALAARAPRATEAIYRGLARRRGLFGRLVSRRAAERARRRIAARA